MFDDKKEDTPVSVNHFGSWIKTIPVGDYDHIRHEIISKCKITNQIFTHWKLGNTKVPPLAQPIVNEIAGRNIFDNGN
jgi:hypothetical protein